MKYIKPESLTWWAAMYPLAMGLFIATEPLHGLTSYVEAVGNITGNVGAYALINAGVAGIGLRGAIK